MKQSAISKTQRDMLGRIIADPRGIAVDRLGLWAGPKARTYRSLFHRALITESRRKSKVGLGREVITVKATKLGKEIYAEGEPRPLDDRDLVIGMFNDSFGAGT